MSHADAPVRIGHYHLNVTSVEAQKKFWADMLGGGAMKFGIDAIEFPWGVSIQLTESLDKIR